jgi:hypothetical protein
MGTVPECGLIWGRRKDVPERITVEYHDEAGETYASHRAVTATCADESPQDMKDAKSKLD